MRRNTATIFAVCAAAGMAAALVPVAALVERVLTDAHARTVFLQAVSSWDTWSLMATSALVSGSVGLVSLLLGLSMGIVLERTNSRSRTLLLTTLVPIALPPYFLATGLSNLLAPGAAVEHLLGPQVRATLDSFLFGAPGTVLVHAMAFSPITALMVMAALKRLDPSLEEAALLLGGWPATLRRVTIPLVLPSAAAGSLLVFLLSLGEITVPLFFHHRVFASESYTRIGAFYDFAGGAALALPLLAVALVVLAAGRTLFLRAWKALSTPPPQRRSPSTTVRALGPAGWLFAAASWSWTALSLILMASAVAPAIVHDAFPHALEGSLHPFLRSATYGVLAGVLLALWGYVSWRSARVGFMARALAAASLTVLTIPPVTLGLGALSIGLDSQTGTVAVVMARHMLLGTALVTSHMAHLPPSLEEAGAVLGIPPWLREIRIVLPLAIPSLMTAWALGYMLMTRDTAIGMVLYPPGGDTLPIRTFTLLANGDPAVVASLEALTAVVVLVPSGVAFWWAARRRSWFVSK